MILACQRDHCHRHHLVRARLDSGQALLGRGTEERALFNHDRQEGRLAAQAAARELAQRRGRRRATRPSRATSSRRTSTCSSSPTSSRRSRQPRPSTIDIVEFVPADQIDRAVSRQGLLPRPGQGRRARLQAARAGAQRDRPRRRSASTPRAASSTSCMLRPMGERVLVMEQLHYRRRGALVRRGADPEDAT